MIRSVDAWRGPWLALALASVLAGCATARPVAPPVSGGGPGGASPRLPSVPATRGELRVDVVYPPEGASIAVRDSTFIFGNVGRGDASLTINGQPVEIAPNGAWLAFLPVPASGIYELSATAAGQTVTGTRTVRVPAAAAPAGGELRIVEGSISPAAPVVGSRGERIEVRFRGTPGGEARLRLPDGRIVPMFERTAVDRVTGFMLDQTRAGTNIAEYVASFELAETIPVADPSVGPSHLLEPEAYARRRSEIDGGAVVELVRGSAFVQLPLPAPIGVLEPGRPRVAVAATSRPDSTVIGRRQVGSDQAWDFFWPNGTLLVIDGESQGFYRVRLTPELTAWVVPDDVRLLPIGAPPPAGGFVGPSIQVQPTTEGLDIRFGMSDRLPFRVVPSESGLSVEFYGATGRPAYVGYGSEDEFLREVRWEQRTDDQFVFDVVLDEALWGYRYEWEGSSLLLHVRRPPQADPRAPLRGLRIGVDAGHRGSATDIGAIGPTRLTEAEATLAVARRLSELLRAQGAEVVEIRPDTTIVPLIDRPVIADRENAHLLVSVHFNAFPDGVNPFTSHGTLMLFYWPHSLEFARHLQREILGELGLPDRGVRFQNVAMVRPTWMPAVLTESLFMMFPEQEAALRDPAVIDRIARAHLRAMESFVAGTAARGQAASGR